MSSIAADLLECPVCLDTLQAPIYQCETGHSLCRKCTLALTLPKCPICREPMTQIRNRKLEELLGEATLPCPNSSIGCKYNVKANNLEDHIKQCIFREMNCPLGVVFGKCSWSGKLKDMKTHFKDRHPQNCDVELGSDIEYEINNLKLDEDERFVYLASLGNLLFVITMKLDTLQGMAYWAVQLIGGKHAANQHIYEIHVQSNVDNRRQAIFTEHCYNDVIKADDVFKMSKCAMMTVNSLKNFVKNGRITFKVCIRKTVQESKEGKGDNVASNSNIKGNRKGPNKESGPRNNAGPRPNAHKANTRTGPNNKGNTNVPTAKNSSKSHKAQ